MRSIYLWEVFSTLPGSGRFSYVRQCAEHAKHKAALMQLRRLLSASPPLAIRPVVAVDECIMRSILWTPQLHAVFELCTAFYSLSVEQAHHRTASNWLRILSASSGLSSNQPQLYPQPLHTLTNFLPDYLSPKIFWPNISGPKLRFSLSANQ